jgi:hypothetical protein
MAPLRTAQINSFCMQHEWHLEAPAGVHIGGTTRHLCLAVGCVA